MKLRLADRLALFIGGIIAILSGLLLIVLSLTGILGVTSTERYSALARWLLPLAGILLLLLGAYLLTLLRRMRHRQDSVMVAQTDNGEMRISVRALEDIVRRCVYLQRGIGLKAIQVSRQRDTVQVQVRITGDPGMDMPAAVTRLQQDIRREMLASAGINAGDIKVTVDSAPPNRLFDRRVPAPVRSDPNETTNNEHTGGKDDAGT